VFLASQTSQGIIFAVSAIAFIVFPFIVFMTYEHRVSRQQKLLMSSAQRSNAIVESLFPSNVRDKLYPQDTNDNDSGTPIADLHPDTTVLFAGMFIFFRLTFNLFLQKSLLINKINVPIYPV
jgi:hypothetical protein